jgi:hypothetical protein
MSAPFSDLTIDQGCTATGKSKFMTRDEYLFLYQRALSALQAIDGLRVENPDGDMTEAMHYHANKALRDLEQWDRNLG